MNKSKKSVVIDSIFGKVSSVAGYGLVVIGLIGLAVELTSDFDRFGIILALIFLGSGALLVLQGLRVRNRIIRFRNYVVLILNRQITAIDVIAANVSKSTHFVREDLQKMINKRYFTNAFINPATNEIVIADTPWLSLNQQQPQADWDMFTCHGCGATGAKQKDTLVHCRFCGSPIK